MSVCLINPSFERTPALEPSPKVCPISDKSCSNDLTCESKSLCEISPPANSVPCYCVGFRELSYVEWCMDGGLIVCRIVEFEAKECEKERKEDKKDIGEWQGT